MFTKRQKRRLRQYYGVILGAIVLNLIFPVKTNASQPLLTPVPSSTAPAVVMSPPPVETVAAVLPSLPSIADKPEPPPVIEYVQPIKLVKQPSKAKHVPVVADKSAKQMVVRASAYSSTVDQTDSSPFITANGSTVHEGTLAINGLPFGTRIKIPSHYGDQVFVVEDRMNARMGTKHIDIWMPTRQAALNWGVRTVVIHIL